MSECELDDPAVQNMAIQKATAHANAQMQSENGGSAYPPEHDEYEAHLTIPCGAQVQVILTLGHRGAVIGSSCKGLSRCKKCPFGKQVI